MDHSHMAGALPWGHSTSTICPKILALAGMRMPFGFSSSYTGLVEEPISLGLWFSDCTWKTHLNISAYWIILGTVIFFLYITFGYMWYLTVLFQHLDIFGSSQYQYHIGIYYWYWYLLYWYCTQWWFLGYYPSSNCQPAPPLRSRRACKIVGSACLSRSSSQGPSNPHDFTHLR